MLILASAKGKPKSIADMQHIQGDRAKATYLYNRSLQRLVQARLVKVVTINTKTNTATYALTQEGINFLNRSPLT